MKPRLIFVDDDPQELDDFGWIVQEEYEYFPIQWPTKKPIEDLIQTPPALFVLDLYFPPEKGAVPSTIPGDALTKQSALARKIGKQFSELYNLPLDGKKLLRETFSCIQSAYDLLWEQCRELKQSPEIGRTLLANLRAHHSYKRVPIVFYSRKVTVEEAMRTLEAGAVAVIHKPQSPPSRSDKEYVLTQLRRAQEVNRSWKVRFARRLGLNVNITLFKHEIVTQKTELTGFKIGT